MAVRAGMTLLLLLTMGLGTNPVFSATRDTDPPQQVEVGCWLSGIHSIDFLDGSFSAEFYLWWISPDPDFRPFETMQLLNGRDWSTRSVNRRQLADGSYHTSGFVSATVNHDWELLYYPFDRQHLKVVLETPYTASEMRLVPNRQASVVSKFLDVEGFEVANLDLQEHIERYNTDFGFRDDEGHEFSRLVINIELLRESGRIVFAILIGFIIANLIALLTYTIHVSMLGIRATMVSSAIFAAIGNMYLLNKEVHPAVGSLLVDRFALGTFGAILIALLNAIVVDRLVMWKNLRLARKINWSVFTLVLVGFALYYGLTFHAAIR